jgi:hypothetical protein
MAAPFAALAFKTNYQIKHNGPGASNLLKMLLQPFQSTKTSQFLCPSNHPRSLRYVFSGKQFWVPNLDVGLFTYGFIDLVHTIAIYKVLRV